jgi:hypothetical protein
MEAGCCLGSEGNRASVGEGGEGLPEMGISSRCPTKAGTTWGWTRKTNQVRRDRGGLA